MSIWTTVGAPVVAPPSIPVLSVGNLKGGVGKTTVVANMAAALVRQGKRVLAIDLDFQASLSVAFPPSVIPRYEESDGGVNVLLGDSYDMFHDARVSARGIGPFSDLSLVRTTLDLADVEDRMFARFILGQSQNDDRFALARKLADPRLGRDFDIVIIDTPPRLTIASINALCASTHVLIPTALTPLSASGAVTFATFVKEFRARLCPRLSILSVLPTFTNPNLSISERSYLERIKKNLSGIAFWDDHSIPRRQAFANNNLADAHARQLFESLSEKLIQELRVGRNARAENRRPDHRFDSGRRVLS
jgi:cellulose biosynthesis protein BcsQ